MCCCVCGVAEKCRPGGGEEGYDEKEVKQKKDKSRPILTIRDQQQMGEIDSSPWLKTKS